MLKYCGPKIYDRRKKLDEENKFHLDDSIWVSRVNGANLDKNKSLGKTLFLLNEQASVYVS